MAETEVVAPPPVPTEETFAKDATDKREGKPERPKREPEEVPDMTVEEAQKALNALPKVCMMWKSLWPVFFLVRFPPERLGRMCSVLPLLLPAGDSFSFP